MKTPRDAFGNKTTHPEDGPYECKGSGADGFSNNMRYSPEQVVWMKENKPLYYTGKLHLDISHLPKHLCHC